MHPSSSTHGALATGPHCGHEREQSAETGAEDNQQYDKRRGRFANSSRSSSRSLRREHSDKALLVRHWHRTVLIVASLHSSRKQKLYKCECIYFSVQLMYEYIILLYQRHCTSIFIYQKFKTSIWFMQSLIYDIVLSKLQHNT